MSRRRSRKDFRLTRIPTHIKKKETIKSKKKINWIPLVLVAIFFLVLFFNSYFNYTSGIAHNPEGTTLGTRFYVSGPDPYYNMRTCEQSLGSGYYRFVTEKDPLLNYPMGHYGSSRPPLFNMIAISTTRVLENVMPRTDALGWSMLWLPAIYGALLVLPVYGIGKLLFNKKAALIAAFFVAIIPIHISSGHGSAFSLFDHDSFLLLLFTCTFFFMLKSLKEKNFKISLGYAGFTGVFMAAIQMTWVSSYFIFLLLVLFLIVHMIFDVLKGLKNIDVAYKVTTALTVGFLISLPYFITRGSVFTYPLFAIAAAYALTILYYILKKLSLPWLITIPTLSAFLVTSLSFLYLVQVKILHIPSLSAIAGLIFGEGIYGTKVALTIAEASTFPLSLTVMSFGPTLFWLGLAGFVLFLFRTHKGKWQSYHLFFIIVFLVNFWLTTTAGRFLNDMIPAMVIFSGFIIWTIIDKLNFKQMIKNIKTIGGLRGIRKGIKLLHLIGVCFIAFLVILPNVFLALDAAVPPGMKEDVFGEGYVGRFGLGLGQSYMWAEACYWLSQQDTEIENPEDRPAFISWWDYGFYIASMGGHPTVADNYQRGIQAAGNFHTAATEQEAVAVLIIRIAEGRRTTTKYPEGILDDNVKEVFEKHLGNDSVNLINYMEIPTSAPSYDTLIKPEYGNDILRVTELNAMYHDCCDIITKLSDKEITMLYHDMMNATGYSIRYYGIDQRDLTSIFSVFPFLSDKATHGFLTTEDDYFITLYYDREGDIYYTLEELNNMSESEIRELDITPITQRKQAFFETFIYRTYYGVPGEEGNFPENRIPTYLLKHFKTSYASPYITITKYYEGAIIHGKIKFNNISYNESMAVVLFDNYNIPHDVQYILPNGLFELISVPGNVSVRILHNNNEISSTSIIITEEEAMWEVPYIKEITIEV